MFVRQSTICKFVFCGATFVTLFHYIWRQGAPQHSSVLKTSSCSPKSSLSFVKIHKAGSGAIHNILLSRALRYNLSVALPYCRGHQNHYQVFPQAPYQKFIMNKAPFKDFHDYNMFFDHATYNRTVQMQYMAADTVFFTQIRHPFTQAQSVFHHFGGPRKYGLQHENSPLTTFLEIQRKEFFLHASQCFVTKHAAPVAKNFQAFTLGFMNAADNNISEFKTFLERLDSEMYFVSILEYIDESSLLLKRKMCWHIRDLLHIHTHKTKAHAKTQSNADEMTGKELHRKRSQLDYILYEFFKEKLLKEIHQQPADFHEELELYRALNKQLSELCDRMCEDFDGISPKDITTIRIMLQNGTHIPSSKFYSAFRLTYVDCLKLMSKEVILKRMLKVHQYPHACDNPNIASEYGLLAEDCDFAHHVHPGYHINHFKTKFLNKEACLGNFY